MDCRSRRLVFTSASLHANRLIYRIDIGYTRCYDVVCCWIGQGWLLDSWFRCYCWLNKNGRLDMHLMNYERSNIICNLLLLCSVPLLLFFRRILPFSTHTHVSCWSGGVTYADQASNRSSSSTAAPPSPHTLRGNSWIVDIQPSPATSSRQQLHPSLRDCGGTSRDII